MKYCISCGEQKPIRWPKHDPVACSKTCVANAFLEYCGLGEWEAEHCVDCGDDLAHHGDECDEEGEC